MRIIRYEKLVRDRIPEIIRASGKSCATEVLSDEAYLRMIDAKLDEELAEYHQEQNLEELADLLEVLRAAVIARGYTLDKLESVRAQKAAKRGGFAQKILLKEVIEKDLVKNEDKLRELGFTITLHDKMPDVVLYSEEKNWLYFIESVTSVGPMEPKRIKEIEEMTTGVTAGKIYVTAFLDFKTFKKFSETLAWETEVWIADMPDHMIHLNGDKFLELRK